MAHHGNNRRNHGWRNQEWKEDKLQIHKYFIASLSQGKFSPQEIFLKASGPSAYCDSGVVGLGLLWHMFVEAKDVPDTHPTCRSSSTSQQCYCWNTLAHRKLIFSSFGETKKNSPLRYFCANLSTHATFHLFCLSVSTRHFCTKRFILQESHY